MSEPLSNPPLPSQSEQKTTPIGFVPPPLFSENPHLIDQLKESVDLEFEKPKKREMPKTLDPQLVGENETMVVFLLKELSKYPRTGWFYYPGSREIQNNPEKIEAAKRDSWEKTDEYLGKGDLGTTIPILYQTIKENRFKRSTITRLNGYMRMLVINGGLPESSKHLIDMEEMEKIVKESEKDYKGYTLDQRREFGEDVAEFVTETLWRFAPQEPPPKP